MSKKRNRFIGSRGYDGYEDYPGARHGRNDFGVSSPTFSGEIGIRNRDFLMNSHQGYRAYQDYGFADRVLDAEHGYSGKGPKGYRRSDENIYDEVCERLTTHYDVDATDVEVEVNDGVVRLGGAVASRRMKRYAEDIAAGVNGVIDVRNELYISARDTPPLRSPRDSTDSTLGKRH